MLVLLYTERTNKLDTHIHRLKKEISELKKKSRANKKGLVIGTILGRHRTNLRHTNNE